MSIEKVDTVLLKMKTKSSTEKTQEAASADLHGIKTRKGITKSRKSVRERRFYFRIIVSACATTAGQPVLESHTQHVYNQSIAHQLNDPVDLL